MDSRLSAFLYIGQASLNRSPVPEPDHLVVAITGGTGMEPSPHLLGEVVRGGGLGVVDLAAGDAWMSRALRQCGRRAGGTWECGSAETVRSHRPKWNVPWGSGPPWCC
ncbi:hypothetical protein [Kibdelosporangium philippinense]|uniref:hypothetical protein n=1 Tax=Kibdelosporangium philippinense TaxID=211113 RepID=UPI003608C6C7